MAPSKVKPRRSKALKPGIRLAGFGIAALGLGLSVTHYQTRPLRSPAGQLNPMTEPQGPVEAQCHPGNSVCLDPETTTAKDLCSTPYEAVCGNAVSARAERNTLGIEREIERRALERLARKYGFSPPTREGMDPLPFYQRWLAVSEFPRFKAEELVDYPGFRDRERALPGILAEAKRLLTQALENRSALLASELGEMKDRVQEVELVLASEILTGSLEATEYADMLQSFCGPNWLVSSAFRIEKFKWTKGRRKTSIVICPGKLLDLANSVADPNSVNHEAGLELPLLGTFGHELAHQIDFRAFPDIYESMKTCLFAHFPHELYAPGYSNSDHHPGWEMIESNLKEATADFWEAEVLALALTSAPSRDRKAALLKRAASWLCGGNYLDDVIPNLGHPARSAHASKKFRADMIGLHPSIRLQLGCEGDTVPKRTFCPL